MVIVYNTNKPMASKSYMVLKGTEPSDIRFGTRNESMVRTVHLPSGIKDLPKQFNCSNTNNLQCYEAILHFAMLYVGDCEFISNLQSQLNSASDHCILCNLCPGKFGSGDYKMMDETDELQKQNLKQLGDGGSTKQENNVEHSRIKNDGGSMKQENNVEHSRIKKEK
jgi:hypothetical protein